MNAAPKDKLDPHFNPDVLSFLDGLLRGLAHEARVLEIGSGGSTLWLAPRAQSVVSYEHDAGWHDLVRDALVARYVSNVSLRLAPRPYAPTIRDKEPADWFDLVIVDGRDRVQSFAAALPKLKRGGVILLDDSQRERYALALGKVPGDWDRGMSEAYYIAEGPHPAVCRRTSWWRRP